MGILQSVTQYETDEEENPISGLNSYSFNNGEKLEHKLLASTHQWQNPNHSIHSHQMKHLTISVPNLGDSSSLAHTTVNEKVNSSSVFVKERIGIDSYSGTKGEEKQREEGQAVVNCTVVAAEGRWIKHYSSFHRILLVGEGDFSFSKCLAKAFGFASNMVATSLDSEAFLLKNYENALSNIVELGIRKCKVMHEIDATKMANHAFLGEIKFDRIIFNFPFAGFFRDVSRDSQLRRHKKLVGRFLKNAREMINESGEIHITHKTNGIHMEWNLESLASSHRLRLVEAVDFRHLDYPGYNTKYGFGATKTSVAILARPTNLDFNVERVIGIKLRWLNLITHICILKMKNVDPQSAKAYTFGAIFLTCILFVFPVLNANVNM